MSEQKRRPWSDKETTDLISYWDTVGSIVLISMILGRSQSSVQTQASRIGLPRRSKSGGKHRRRWTPDDENTLANVVKEYDGREIPITDIADRLDRSIDAVAVKLADMLGGPAFLVKRLETAALMQKSAASGAAAERSAAARRSANPNAKTRKCLCCGKPFWSEGVGHRICNKCRKNYEEYNWDWM